MVPNGTKKVATAKVAPKEVKKKRGRKPKNKVVAAPDTMSTMATGPLMDTMIIKIIPKQTELSALPGHSIPMYQSAECLDGPGTACVVGGSGVSEDIAISTSASRICWNCGDSQCNPCSIPYKRHLNVYYMMGSFCTYACGSRYIYDTYEGRDIWERYTLLNMYYNETMGTHGKSVQAAPPKYALQEYGGTLTRTQYRETSETESQYILPPLIPVDYTPYSGGSNIKNGDGAMKLYRLKPVKQNHILDSLNII